MKKMPVFKAVLILMLVVFAAGCGQGSKGFALGKSPVDDLYVQAQTLASEGKLLEAKAAFEKIDSEHPDYKDIEKVQDELYAVNMKVLFSDIETPQTVIHEVQPGETLGKISKQYNVPMLLIKTSNNMKDDVVRAGQKLRIWTGKFSVYVNKSQNVLMLKSNEDVLKVYHVSTGANNSTPVGTFKIVVKLENPVWFKTGGPGIPAESPENALGTRWLGFDKEGYGIHGTIEPDKIGQQVTNGCVRMRNAEVEELYTVLPRGTEVNIVD
ncbi:MAG: L,D-transpeptidase family protein [Candidatus Omnitrophica bacterium]|nr:L,D-transpeptidase family protein [Candidatus Omnitrophota bacterium]